MKRTLYFLLSFTVAVAAAACSTDDVVAPDSGNGRRVVLTGYSNADATRTSFGAVGGNTIPFLWSAADRVWVDGQQSEAAGTEGSAASFVFDNLAGNAPFEVYYNMAGPSYDVAKIPNIQIPLKKYSADLGANGDFGYAVTDADGNFRMEHLASYLWFSPWTPDIEFKLASIRFAVEGVDVAGTASFTGGTLGAVSEGSEFIAMSLGMDNYVLPSQPETDRMLAVMVAFPLDLTGKTVRITYSFFNPDTMASETYVQSLPGFEMQPGATYRIAPEITMDDLADIVLYRADGGAWSETMPESFTTLAVKTEKSGLLTDAIHTAIAAALTTGAELDFSEAVNESETFGNHYRSVWRGYWDENGLKKIVLPKNITKLYDPTGQTNATELGAFNHCSYLEEVVLPEGMTDLGRYAFTNCTALIDINIPSTVTSLGDWAFKGCLSLEEIILPDGIEELKTSTFEGCTGLRFVNLPAQLKTVGTNEFANCTSLESIEIPGGLKDIPGSSSSNSGMFYGAKSLRTVAFNEGLETIGNATFYNCPLEEINLPLSVKSIGNHCFYNAGATLTEVYLDVETIGNYCFFTDANKSIMEKIAFGPRVKSIGARAFPNIYNVATIVFESTDCPSITSSSFDGAGQNVADGQKKIYIPDGSYASYMVNSTISTLVSSLGFAIVEGDGSATLPEGIWYSQTGADGEWESDFSGFTGQYLYARTVGTVVLTAADCLAIETFVNSRGTTLTIVDLSRANYESNVSPEKLFQNSRNIFELSLPANIEVVSEYTGCYCPQLRAIILGDKVTEIRGYTGTPDFMTDNWVAVVCKSPTAPALDSSDGYGWPFSTFMGSRNPKLECYVPAGSVAAYQNDAVWDQRLGGSLAIKSIDELTEYYWRNEL